MPLPTSDVCWDFLVFIGLVLTSLKFLPLSSHCLIFCLGETKLQLSLMTFRHSSNLAWRIPWTVHGVSKSRTRLSNFHFHYRVEYKIHNLELINGAGEKDNLF